MTTIAAPHAGISLADRYGAVRDLTETLASPLSPEDQTVQSMPDVSPTKWHRAHTTWFFETFLLTPGLAGYRERCPEYGYLFNSYYEAVGARHPRAARGVITRPGIEEVAAYRRHVDGAMADLVERLERRPEAGTLGLVELGVHHEQQHQELLLMDIKHVLSRNLMRPTYRDGAAAGGPAPASGWAEHHGGVVEIGHDGDGFAFDNESPRHPVLLAPFAVADRPVTCGEWQAFIDEGGYRRPELWLSDGWYAVQAEGWEAPLYWSRDGDGWEVFTLHGPKPVDPAEPVCHVSLYEADAFARWAGARLPTEAEWEVAVGPRVDAGQALDLGRLHPAAGGGPGQVWEWTGSAYLAYPGFRPAAGAVGEYNGKFMSNQHVLRGGCCVTPGGHTRPTYRNFFPPSARWPFTGVRLARDL
jgi:ergothioneine biosynthesis protein EgtB